MSYVVLLVDDSPIIRTMLRRAIGLAGLDVGDVLEAEHGRAALDLLNEVWVDLVFADIHMPVMDGVELVDRMQADVVLSTVPVVMVTAERSPEVAARLTAKGVRAYLTKPFRPEEIREVALALLGGSGTEVSP